MEWLSKALKAAAAERRIKAFVTRKRALEISHLLFADDILIFTNGSTTSVDYLLQIVSKFCVLSGEELNASKSFIIFPEHMDSRQTELLLGRTGFSRGTLPMTYLGVPLYRGRTLISYFEYLVSNMQKRIEGWSKRFLSMGGRVTLVNSVLSAIGIHAMLVLPVPKGIISRMRALMANFIWDDGGQKRKHWIGWQRLCCERKSGGFGLRDPMQTMLALQGKLAWTFITGDTLWAKFARSRFKVGHEGSPLWNAINHIIPAVREMGYWRIGNGETCLNDICKTMGYEVHSAIRREKLFQVLANPGQRDMFLFSLPVAERMHFDNVVFSSSQDVFAWKLSTDGTFSTKSFFMSFQTRYGDNTWGEHIWKPWIPTKISCFVWKMFHNIVPSDANVRNLGIPMCSRCSCCRLPATETSHHLLFQGDLATKMWRKLAVIFGRNPPRGHASLLRFWLKAPKKDFVANLAATMACCTLWEIWKFRNSVRHDRRTRDTWKSIIAWGSKLAPNIRMPMQRDDHQSLFHGLRIKHPPIKRDGCWYQWRAASTDLTLNIAVVCGDEQVKIGGIVRMQDGQFVFANVVVYEQSTLMQGVETYLSSIRQLADEHRWKIMEVQSSHYSFINLQAEEYIVPGDWLHTRRSIFREWPNSSFVRVKPGSNQAALAVVYTTDCGAHWHISSLHRAARIAITSDILRLPTVSDISVRPHFISSDDINIRYM